MQPKLPIVILLLLLLGLSNISKSQNVNIPDANFKALLVGNPLINTNGDGEIQETEAMAFAGTIDVHNQLIYDLTGIEAFRNLKELDCSECKLSNLDLSANTSLMILNCMDNTLKSLNVSNTVLTELYYSWNPQLMNLDISNLTSLIKLYCSNNSLTSLDVSKNTFLEELSCYDNSLTSLDVSKNSSLKDLNCSNNSLTSLDVSKNLSLKYLNCAFNRLTNLDVSANTALNGLSCYSNQLISLDLADNQALETLSCDYNNLTSIDVSTNVSLWGFHCSHNQLTSLDLTANTLLTEIDLSYNLLQKLNVNNENNHIIKYIYAKNNLDLKCIQVDNAFYSNDNWSSRFDPWASFSETCTVGIDNFSTTEINIFPNPSNGIFTISGLPMGALCIEIYNLIGEKIYSRNSTQTVSDIDISYSPKGIYFVKVSDVKKIHINKIEIR